MKKPFTYNGKRYFPEWERKQLFGWLKPGDQFTTIQGQRVYVKSVDDMATCEDESKFFPEKMPVIPVKHY